MQQIYSKTYNINMTYINKNKTSYNMNIKHIKIWTFARFQQPQKR